MYICMADRCVADDDEEEDEEERRTRRTRRKTRRRRRRRRRRRLERLRKDSVGKAESLKRKTRIRIKQKSK